MAPARPAMGADQRPRAGHVRSIRSTASRTVASSSARRATVVRPRTHVVDGGGPLVVAAVRDLRPDVGAVRVDALEQLRGGSRPGRARRSNASRSGGRDAVRMSAGSSGCDSASAALDRRERRGPGKRHGAAPARGGRAARARAGPPVAPMSRHVVSLPPATDTMPLRPRLTTVSRRARMVLAPPVGRTRTPANRDRTSAGAKHIGGQRPSRLGQDLRGVRIGGGDVRRIAVVRLVGGAEEEHPLPRDRERHPASRERRRHRRRPFLAAGEDEVRALRQKDARFRQPGPPVGGRGRPTARPRSRPSARRRSPSRLPACRCTSAPATRAAGHPQRHDLGVGGDDGAGVSGRLRAPRWLAARRGSGGRGSARRPGGRR